MDEIQRAQEAQHEELAKAPSNDGGIGADDKGLELLENMKSKVEAAKEKMHLHDVRATGPSKFFNPTNVRMHVHWRGDSDSDESNAKNDMALLWRSRDNRKGRNSIAVPAQDVSQPRDTLGKRIKSRLITIGQNTLRICTTFPYWEMAFWSGWSYSIGSILFVIDGVWAWGPLAWPDSNLAENEGIATYGVTLNFFFGAILYQVGATMAYLEAINDGSFQGSAMKRLLEGHEEDQKRLLDEKLHGFFGHMVPHHSKHKDQDHAESRANGVDPEAGWNTKHTRERPGSIYPQGKAPAPRRGGMDLGPAEEGEVAEYTSWRWWPTWHGLRTHHLREIGYIACTIQLFGATLYGMCGVVVLPGILDSLSGWQTLAAYWVPQIVASCCFLTAGILFTLEVQDNWYKPIPDSVGWWIGVWATIGSIGFL